MAELTCEEAAAASAEVALDVADAATRAAVLHHAAGCGACRAELLGLSEAADLLPLLAPPVEPPPGFELAVLGRLAPRRRRLRRPLAAVAAAALLVAGWAAGRSGGDRPPSRPGVAALTADGHPAGQVVVGSTPYPWISMSVRVAEQGPLRCEVTSRGGSTTVVGTFSLRGGEGWWAAPLPPRSVPVAARLVDSRGVVVASASLSP